MGYVTYEFVREIWPELMAVLHALLATGATCHAVLTKDEPSSAIGWVGLIWLSPIMGSVLYYLLGINRIRRKAVAIKGTPAMRHFSLGSAGAELAAGVFGKSGHLESLVRLGDEVVEQPLSRGNKVTPFLDGDTAYPAMLAAIAAAETSIMMSSYIFDNDNAGREFAGALSAAVRRGVEVRVLIDATGSRYTFPSIIGPLRRAGVRTAQFMPNFVPTKMSAFNLRSHRKIMVLDGVLGFTGGMNIRQGNYVKRGYPDPTQDLHFQIEGPVVAHLRQAFIEDWAFTTKEVLAGPKWLVPLHAAGDVLARGLADGPDRDFEKILWVNLGAIATATQSIRIITPYFLPDASTVRFLIVAAMRGVRVEIILPEQSNIKLVQWASMPVIAPLLAKGVHVYLQRPPFDHSKILIVDDAWVSLGSSNWDARSLRLNFEFNIECYSPALAAAMNAIYLSKKKLARPLHLAEITGRSYPVKIRDGVVRLLAPYL